MENVLLDYEELLTDSEIRLLISTVKFNNQTFKLSDDQSAAKEYIEILYESDTFHDLRLKIKKFITKHYFNRSEESFDKLYYERRFSLTKLMIVGLIMESINLKRMGGDPDVSDVPMAYAQLAKELVEAEANWEKIQMMFSQEHVNNCGIGMSLVRHYLN
jgi:hypothetical protein